MEPMKPISPSRFLFFLSLLLTLCLLLSACGGSNTAASGKIYDVAPEFQFFYGTLGGENVLGPTISKLLEMDSSQCQYTANALMCLEIAADGTQRFYLSPLGTSFGVGEVPPATAAEGSLVVNGFTVYEEFIPLYNNLSQVTYAGNPLGQVHLNYDRQRIEQFFENVGFYRNFSDAPGTVKLLAYGAESCSRECSYRAALEARFLDEPKTISNRPLINQMNNITNADDFGKPLGDPYLAADGNMEQVYPGIVLYQEAGTGTIKLRPLSILLGMTGTPPAERRYGNDEAMVFYAVDGSLGYHVPALFDDFINTHGGTVLSGNPIAEAFEFQPGVVRQCFVNYCLDYSPSAPKKRRVTVAELGSQYIQQVQPGIIATQPPAAEVPPADPGVTLQIAEQFARVSDAEEQVIHIVTLVAANQSPAPGIQTSISVTLPEGKTWSAPLPVTAADGTSSIAIPAMKNLPNGTILAYQVCVNNSAVCAAGTYLMWTEP